MKLPRVLIACLSLALVAMTMFSHVSAASHGHPTNNDEPAATENPCHDVWENTTVPTPDGPVLCIVPTEEELTEQLKSVGGYNKHYVAVTEEEADNFEPILPGWDGTKPTKPSRPSRCRRRRGHPSFRRRRRNWKRNEKASRKEDNVFLERSKRFDQPGIKVSTKMHCQPKGEKVDNLYQMCDKCQIKTELTTDRFPQYINEVTCESKDGSPTDGTELCRPQFGGKCVQGYLVIDLLKRTGKYDSVSPPTGIFKAYLQKWEPYSHSIRSCCECHSHVLV